MKNNSVDESTASTDALRARRAIGAMFFSFFGGAWLTYWAYQTFVERIVFASLVIAATLILAFFAYRKYRQFQAALVAEPPSPAKKKADRVFNIVNVT
jgi:hypothetical protein